MPETRDSSLPIYYSMAEIPDPIHVTYHVDSLVLGGSASGCVWLFLDTWHEAVATAIPFLIGRYIR